MLRTFRIISLIEGLSLITLLFIAMPAKYHFGYFDIIFYAGMTHGILWMIYFIMSLPVSHQRGWSVAFWAVVITASVIPFACFFLDRKFKQALDNSAPATT